jgi:molybdopterin molybdotransferase
MIELEEAQKRIQQALPAPQPETATLSEAAGRYVIGAIAAPMSLPPFDNSAMDGYAVLATDLRSASLENPVALRQIGRVPAGQVHDGPLLASGQCLRIFTGSPLPAGADAVIMQEDTRPAANAEDTIECLDSVKPWEHIRLSGEDVKAGANLLHDRDRLTLGRISVLSAVGIPEVVVGRRPIVGLVATGDELKQPGDDLKPGEIFESNRLTLAQFIARSGGVPISLPLVPDRLDATVDALRSAFDQCDIVITSGGASVGEMDFVKEAFAALGGTQEFWRVRIKPGKPFVFGSLGEKLLFGLPGNPVSAIVTFLMLARPAIVQFQGGSENEDSFISGTLTEPLVNHGNRRHFVRVKIDGNGGVRQAGLQASHALGALLDANGLVDTPPETTIPAGEKVRVFRWD